MRTLATTPPVPQRPAPDPSARPRVVGSQREQVGIAHRPTRFGSPLGRVPPRSPGPPWIQTRLEVSRRGDESEREAERIADRVVRLTAPAAPPNGPVTVQRSCATCAEDEQEELSILSRRSTSVMRQALAGQADDQLPFTQALMRREAPSAASGQPPRPSPPVEERLDARRGGGETLPDSTRQKMEGAFGHDFSRVRIHRDLEAAEMSRQLNALAFTHGSDIYFGRGRYEPQGAAGTRLLAHELTHVVQQRQAAAQPGDGTAEPLRIAAFTPPKIQRFAIWSDGVVNEVNNLADGFINGGPAGFTPPMLNRAITLSTADARAAIERPTVDVSPAAGGGFTAKVTSSGINIGSFEENVLTPGPWTTVVPRATIGGIFAGLAACAGAGDTTFRAIGDPSDAHMYAANRRHEDHHAADHHAAFDSSLVPWDTNLLLAEVLDEEFHGATAAAAEAALWARMGGTPDDVADEYFNEAVRLNDAFHATPAGGAVGAPTDPASNADCSTSSAKFTNPS